MQSAAPATALLIQLIMEATGEAPSSEEAGLLFFGICTDTGFFRHLGSDTADVFRAVARLVESGASPRDTYHKMYGNQDFEKRRLLGVMLQRTERFCGGRVLFTYQERADRSQLPQNSRGDEELYSLLQTVAGSDVLVFGREEDNRECSFSLRSNESFDVGTVARSFGGGGHRQAAGFTFKGTIPEGRDEVLSLIMQQLNCKSM